MTCSTGRYVLSLALLCAVLASPFKARADQPLTREEIENRRQEIVVAAMKFTDDKEKEKFLEVYIPYQEKLMKILKQRVKLIEEFAQAEKNGSMPEADAWKILGPSLGLDADRLHAEETYVNHLKKILPADKVLRAYQIETRINALYLAVVFDTVPLAR